MERNSLIYQTYVQLLREELVPAMGCTEPIAIAYCAAKARSVLGAVPDRVVVEASGNIIKNVKSVVVPNTGGRRGIQSAAAIGILGGDESRGYEVISAVPEQAKEQLSQYLARTPIEVRPACSDRVLDITVIVYDGKHSVSVRAVNHHTNIIHIERDGGTLLDRPARGEEASETDRSLLNLAGIFDFAKTAALEDVREVIQRQVEYNTAISEEGLLHGHGANVGRTLLSVYGQNVHIRARAAAAAGSDARMDGCELPVVINSGSGNQGMTASLPVIEYAKELGSSQEELYRALLLSNLITLHQKTGIGRLSAYCGAVSAGAAAGAGIAFLHGADLDTVSQTVVNALAVTSGIICDGAKASCAGKIAAAVDAGILGFEMCRRSFRFLGGDGILRDDPEGTIQNVGRLGRIGMRETDQEIIKMMTEY